MRRARRQVRRGYRVFAQAAAGYSDDQGSLVAAALAFYAFLSLFPFLLVVIALLGSVLGSSDRAFDAVVGAVQGALPGAKATVEQQVRAVVEHRAVAGWLGVAGLVYGASGIFATWRSALQAMWDLPPPRTVWGPYVRAVLTVLAAVVLLLISIVATTVVAAVVHYQAFGYSLQQSPLLVRFVGVVVSLLLDWATFILLYLTAGSRRLTWGGRLFGAGVAAVAWEIAKRLFAFYVTHIRFQIYGSLGVVVILMLWFYYSAVIAVFGAELVQAWSDPSPRGHLPTRP